MMTNYLYELKTAKSAIPRNPAERAMLLARCLKFMVICFRHPNFPLKPINNRKTKDWAARLSKLLFKASGVNISILLRFQVIFPEDRMFVKSYNEQTNRTLGK